MRMAHSPPHTGSIDGANIDITFFESQPDDSIQYGTDQYKSIGDIVPPGTDQIWYSNAETFKNQLIASVLNPTHVHQMIDPGNLSKTHKLLGTMDTQNDLDNTFKIFNEWSPRGEANNIIGQLCLNHTSMSVGDVIVQGITGNVYMVDIRGFRQLKTDLDKKRKCNSCGRKKSKDIMLYKCKGCKKKYYCSRKCQKYGWSRGQHRIDCTRVSNH